MSKQLTISPDDILASAESLRWQVGGDFHEHLMESIYTDAARIADRAVTRPDEKPAFDFDRTLDRLLTSRIWGFPLMLGLLTIVFWLTIAGANIPSSWLSWLLLDTIQPILKNLAGLIGLPWWLSTVVSERSERSFRREI